MNAPDDAAAMAERESADRLWANLDAGVAEFDPDHNFVCTDSALYSDFLYVEPFLRRAGFLDLQQFFNNLPADQKASPVDALAAALQAAVRVSIPEEYARLRKIPVKLAPIAGLYGWHALDPESQRQAIAVSAQHIVGLPRANACFANLLTLHLDWQLPGAKYEQDAGLITRFLKLKWQPGGIVASGRDLTRAARTLSRLVERLFDRLVEPEPWILEAEIFEWICSVSLVQQLFVILHELHHAKEKWAKGVSVSEGGVLLRGGNLGHADAEAEDCADVWAVQILIQQVKSGSLPLQAWEGEVAQCMRDHRWPVPTEAEELVAYAIFLYFEYLEAAGRLGRPSIAAFHRPPRDRYDEIRRCLGIVFPTRRMMAEYREFFSTVATAVQFKMHNR